MRVQRKCGCGAETVIEADYKLTESLDVLLDRCNQWEKSHHEHEAKVRERLWTRQSAVADIVASFEGAQRLELSDEARTWVMNLHNAFAQLDVPAL